MRCRSFSGSHDLARATLLCVTIALVIKVSDGLVLASDSATTLGQALSDGSVNVANIYNNANKVFNLHKGLPIGAMTWGLGNIGPSSIATLAKDLRHRFHGDDRAHANWKVDGDSYTIEALAGKARDFLVDGRYERIEQEVAELPEAQLPILGFLVAGYSTGSDIPDAYVMQLGLDGAPELVNALPGDSGAAWWGMPDAISRILNGFSTELPQALVNMELGLGLPEAMAIAGGLKDQLNPQMVPAAMPIQDAIDLAEFLVHATIQFVRFSPGNPTVGGPIEIATITKHEGFKWVKRKHFFDTRLNPSN